MMQRLGSGSGENGESQVLHWMLLPFVCVIMV